MVPYSIIIPVYNRPQEIKELLETLLQQTYADFEVIVVEDGSEQKCDHIVQSFSQKLTIHYHYKSNSGPGLSRNYGMERAQGDYFIIFDSDCLIPPDYLKIVDQHLTLHPLDAFGGPDHAHSSFSDVQKAIDYAMTSFLTTGGIRGGKKKLDRFQPRSFNMGISKKVFEAVGGFSNLHPGEDPDLSYRMIKAGHSVELISEAFVYHKRRIDFPKFIKQVYKFGLARTILVKWHGGSFKAVYALPSVFLVLLVCLILCSFAWPILLAPLLTGALVLFIDAFIKTKSFKIAGLGMVASFMQIMGYGYGFLKGIWHLWIRQKDERLVFPDFFFQTKNSE